MTKENKEKYDGTGDYYAALNNKGKAPEKSSQKNNEENKPVIPEKSFDELLAETEAKLTQKNYYQTEKLIHKGEAIPINFKPLSHKIISGMGRLPEGERIEYLVEKTLYSPSNNRLYSKEELKYLFEGKGYLTERIAELIMNDAGLDVQEHLKQNPISRS